MNVNWRNSVNSGPKSLYFKDLKVGDAFRNKFGKGAVYVKVFCNRLGSESMMELATGKLWEPTRSEVERVNVTVSIDADKPYNLY